MAERKRADSGQFVETVTLEDVLAVFDAVRGPVVTSSDVADALGCTTEAARQKLTRLSDQGRVDRRKTGRTTVYWRTEDETSAPDAPAREREASAEAGGAAGSTPERRDATAGGSRPLNGSGGDTALEDALAGLDTTADRRDAVRACVEYLREEQTAQKSGFVDAVYPEHPAGFGSSGGWWNKIGKEYLRAVAESVDVIAPPAGEGSHTWRYTGEA